MLFGEIGLPDQVENTSESGSAFFARALQSAMSFTAAAERGICRIPASVFGVPASNEPRTPEPPAA
jgi:hypothetical protein